MTKNRNTSGSAANSPKPVTTDRTETDVAVHDSKESCAIYFTGGKVFYNKSGGFAYVEVGAKPAPSVKPKRSLLPDPDDCA